MIVVVGNPAWRAADPAGPAGRACDIALETAQRGSKVELVGRTGDDLAGDALLLALGKAGVGHVAMLRDPVRGTPVIPPEPDDSDDAGPADVNDDPTVSSAADPPGGDGPGISAMAPRLEAGDVSLGLGYLTAFNVLVVVDGVPEPVLPVAVEAAAYTDAHLVLLIAAGTLEPVGLPAAATVIVAPAETDDGAFATLVGAYAAALDGGAAPGPAFAAATQSAGWEALEPSA